MKAKHLYVVALAAAFLSNVNAQYTVLHEFGGSGDGANPSGVIASGNYLYGTTTSGGDNGSGIIFRSNLDGSNYTVLYGATESPKSELTLADGILYGLNSSSLFKINADGTGYSNVIAIAGTSGNARGALVVSGDTIYGAAFLGGSNNQGSIFKVNTNGTGFTVLKEFSSASSGGYGPQQLILSGSTLYGVTSYGGSGGGNSAGTVFKLETDGSNFATLKNLASSEGRYPFTPLTLDGSTLYGTADRGGSSGVNEGTIFSLQADGSNFAVLHEMVFPSTAGINPLTEIVVDGSNLYGTNSSSLGDEQGSIFTMGTNGSGFTVVHPFSSATGNTPAGAIVLSGNVIYGSTISGGANGGGVLYSYTVPEPSTYVLLILGGAALFLIARRNNQTT